MPIMGKRVFGIFLILGFLTMLLPADTGRPIGVTCWAIAVFVGLPWIVTDTVRRHRKA